MPAPRKREARSAFGRAVSGLAATALALAGLAVGLGGCTSSPAPQQWLASPAAAESTAFGGWVLVEFHEAESGAGLQGELIAVSMDSIHVLAGSHLVSMGLARTKRIRVWGYDSQWKGLIAWTVLGALSAASHGWYGAATAPLLWILPGSLIVGGASRDAVVTSPPQPWTALRAFCRFPQGLPRDLDRDLLRGKPAP